MEKQLDFRVEDRFPKKRKPCFYRHSSEGVPGTPKIQSIVIVIGNRAVNASSVFAFAPDHSRTNDTRLLFKATSALA